MIEFKGEISGDCKKFILHRSRNISLFASITTSVLFSIPTIILAITWNIAALVFMVFLLLFVFLSLLPLPKKEHKKIFPNRVFVDAEDEMVVIQGEGFERFHPISSVKRVTDYGKWYYFEFYFGNKDMFVICQKDLLTSGTLEEFESLFEDVLTRKNS